MTVRKCNQVVTPIATVTLDVVSSEQTGMFAETWYAPVDFTCASIRTSGYFAFNWQGQRNTFTVLSHTYIY